jgi:hypothetical protein
MTWFLEFVRRVEANHGWRPPVRINHGQKRLVPRIYSDTKRDKPGKPKRRRRR